MKPIRICLTCSKEFEADAGAKCCSNKCNRAYQYARATLDPLSRLRRLCTGAKTRAKANNLDYNIDADYLMELWEEQEGCCSLSGIKLVLEKGSGVNEVHPYTPSIDKIDSKGGYTRGNVRITCYHMNVALNKYGLEGFDKLVQAYIEYNTGIGS